MNTKKTKKSSPKFVISGSYGVWYLELNVPKMWANFGTYTRRRDAKRAAFRAARLLGLSDCEIKYT